MQIRIVKITVGLLIASMICLSACKKDKGGDRGAIQAVKKTSAPAPLMAYVGLKAPGKTIDEFLALVGQFAPLPLNSAGIIGMFAQKAGLPPTMVAAVDTERPFWVLGLDPKQVKGDTNPMVTLLPLRDRKAFESGLEKKLKKGGTEGKLTVYKPIKASPGAQPLRLKISDKMVWAATSQQAFELVEAFVEGNLLSSAPKHDVVVHLAMKNIFKSYGEMVDQKVEQILGQMKRNMKQSGNTASAEKTGDASEKTLRQWVEALRSAREIKLLADVSKSELALSLQAVAQEKGRLLELIRRQKPGAPYGYHLLPSDSFFVVANRSNPQAMNEQQTLWMPVIQQMIQDLSPEQQKEVQELIQQASEITSGDATTAVHRAPGGKGLTATVVAQVTDAQKAYDLANEGLDALSGWIKAALEKSGKKMPKGVKVKSDTFKSGSARGVVYSIALPLPPNVQEKMSPLLGNPLTVGLAFVEQYGFLTFGRGAKQQLELLVKAAAAGKAESSLATNNAFEAARKAGTKRVGLVYLSVVDLLRALQGSGLTQVETIAAALPSDGVEAAPSVDWGVDNAQKSFDVTLRLPISHFLPFKPILQQLQKGGGLMPKLLRAR